MTGIQIRGCTRSQGNHANHAHHAHHPLTTPTTPTPPIAPSNANKNKALDPNHRSACALQSVKIRRMVFEPERPAFALMTSRLRSVSEMAHNRPHSVSPPFAKSIYPGRRGNVESSPNTRPRLNSKSQFLAELQILILTILLALAGPSSSCHSFPRGVAANAHSPRETTK